MRRPKGRGTVSDYPDRTDCLCRNSLPLTNMKLTKTQPDKLSKDESYTPKTEEEKAEAFKLLDDFLSELAKQQAFRELVVRFAAQNPSSSFRQSRRSARWRN